MRAGRFNQYVQLTHVPKMGGDLEPLSPPDDWVSITPQPPGASDSWTLLHEVGMRYRDDVNLNTRFLLTVRGVTQEFIVRGYQNVNLANVELRLLCEEVIP